MTQQQLKIRRRLVDIVEDFRRLLITIYDNDGEVEDGLLKELQESEEAFETKVESCLLVAEEFKYIGDAYKQRAKALTAHAQAMENRYKRLRELVRDGMVQLQIHKMKTPSFSSIFLKESERLVVKDPDWIIDEFEGDEDVIQFQDPKINKTALKNRLKDSETFERAKDAIDFEHSTSLVVR